MNFSNRIAQKLEVTFAVVPSEGMAVACNEDFLTQKEFVMVDFFAGEIQSAECVNVLMVAKADLLLGWVVGTCLVW
jgi:hypothetical protein